MTYFKFIKKSRIMGVSRYSNNTYKGNFPNYVIPDLSNTLSDSNVPVMILLLIVRTSE